MKRELSEVIGLIQKVVDKGVFYNEEFRGGVKAEIEELKKLPNEFDDRAKKIIEKIVCTVLAYDKYPRLKTDRNEALAKGISFDQLDENYGFHKIFPEARDYLVINKLIKPKDPNERLLEAAANLDLNAAQWAINNGANVNTAEDENNCPALILALEFKRLAGGGTDKKLDEMMQLLISNGADKNVALDALKEVSNDIEETDEHFSEELKKWYILIDEAYEKHMQVGPK